MDAVAKSRMLQKEIKSFKTSSYDDPQKQIDSFLQAFDPYDIKFIRANAQHFDVDFLEALTNLYDDVTPESYLLMMHFFCVLGIKIF